MTADIIGKDNYMLALVNFWLSWSHNFSVEGKKIICTVLPVLLKKKKTKIIKPLVLYRFSLTALSGRSIKVVGQQCCLGDQIIFDRSINNAIGSICSIGPMWQIGATGALQAGGPAKGEVLSTKLQQKKQTNPQHHTWNQCLNFTRVISLSEQQKPPIFYLKLHLVVERLPVQTKVTLCRVDLNFISEVNYTGPPALRCDFSTDGQRPLIGWDWNVAAAWGDVDMEPS